MTIYLRFEVKLWCLTLVRKIEEKLLLWDNGGVYIMNLGNFNNIHKMIENQKSQLIHMEETGMTLDELLTMFAAGWKLSPPPDTVMEFSMEELRRMQEMEVVDAMRRAGYFNAGERVMPSLKTTFSKPEEED